MTLKAIRKDRIQVEVDNSTTAFLSSSPAFLSSSPATASSLASATRAAGWQCWNVECWNLYCLANREMGKLVHEGAHLDHIDDGAKVRDWWARLCRVADSTQRVEVGNDHGVFAHHDAAEDRDKRIVWTTGRV